MHLTKTQTCLCILTCKSAQADTRLCCLNGKNFAFWAIKNGTVKFLIGLCKCAGLSASSLGASDLFVYFQIHVRTQKRRSVNTVCVICDKKFSRAGDQRKHMFKFHGVQFDDQKSLKM